MRSLQLHLGNLDSSSIVLLHNRRPSAGISDKPDITVLVIRMFPESRECQSRSMDGMESNVDSSPGLNFVNTLQQIAIDAVPGEQGVKYIPHQPRDWDFRDGQASGVTFLEDLLLHVLRDRVRWGADQGNISTVVEVGHFIARSVFDKSGSILFIKKDDDCGMRPGEMRSTQQLNRVQGPTTDWLQNIGHVDFTRDVGNDNGAIDVFLVLLGAEDEAMLKESQISSPAVLLHPKSCHLLLKAVERLSGRPSKTAVPRLRGRGDSSSGKRAGLAMRRERRSRST